MAANISIDQGAILYFLDNQFAFVGINNSYMRAGVVLLIFIAAAFLLRFFFKKILSSLVKETKTDIDDKIIETAQNPMLFLVIFVGLFLSGYILDANAIFGAAYSRIFITIISYIIFILVLKTIMIIIHGARESAKDKKNIKVFDKSVFPFVERILKLIGIIIYMFVFFSVWNINLTPLLASAGVLGIAVAFAAKDTIANIFGGFSVFFDKPYEIGDYIVVDGERGEVIDIGLRSTRIRTRDDVYLTIPNSIMATSKVTNQTGIMPKLRVRIDVEVAYNADLDKVERVLLDIAKKADYVEKSPAPKVRFRSFKDYSIHVQLSFWTKKPALKGRHTSWIIKDIHKQFKQENIEFPFPTYDVHVKK